MTVEYKIMEPFNPMFTSERETNTITFNSINENVEMLKITKDGFYVRGIRVNQDEKEAEIVYNAFHQWLMVATLTRTY